MPLNKEGERFLQAQDAVKLLTATFPGKIEFVKLFGSVARGEERPSSDIDLMVVLKDCKEFNRDDTLVTPKMKLVRDMVNLVLDKGFMFPMDSPKRGVHLCVYTERQFLEWFGKIKEAILTEGIQLYPQIKL